MRELLIYPGGKSEEFAIPDFVTSIGNYAFNQCENLKSVEIPGSVTSIGDHAFANCYYLTSVSIPGSISFIGSEAFRMCESLKDVYYASEAPLEAGRDIFPSLTYDWATLYVPEAAVEKCRAIDPWKRFWKIEAYDPTGIKDANADGDTAQPVMIYNLNGVFMGGDAGILTPGVYIERRGDSSRKILID